MAPDRDQPLSPLGWDACGFTLRGMAPLRNEKHLLFENNGAHLAEKPVGLQWTSVIFIVSCKTWNCSKQNTKSESSRREVLLVCK